MKREGGGWCHRYIMGIQLTERPVISAMPAYMVSLLGQLCLSPLEIGFSALDFFKSGGIWGLLVLRRIVERVGIQRVGGGKGVLVIIA